MELEDLSYTQIVDEDEASDDESDDEQVEPGKKRACWTGEEVRRNSIFSRTPTLGRASARSCGF